MDTKKPQLPWDDLQHTEGDIPWPALRRFAEAAATDPAVTHRLFEVYDRAYEIVPEQVCYADLYVPAVFALAAPKLDDEQRREIADFLVDRLVEAGEDEEELTAEALATAVGTLGPDVLPAVLEAIANEPDPSGAWFQLWELTLLAGKTENQFLRQRVIQMCVDLLERVDRNEIDPRDTHSAAWTLGFLQCTEYTDLLQRVCEKGQDSFMAGDYAETVQLLHGELDHTPPPEPWELPVEEWLTYHWKVARDWFASQDDEDEDEEEYLEDEEEVDSRRAWFLSTEFVNSVITEGLPAELLEDADFIADRLVYYSLGYLRMDPEEWDEPALRELLFDILPRKISADEGLFAKVGPVTEAFLSWLGSEGLLEDADALATTVHGWSEQIATAGMDPRNWGPAKRFMMQAEQAGVDITDSAALKAYVAQQQTELLTRHALADTSEPMDYSPPVPIVEHSRKIGRNDPCPCGSGKKYKKCCGNPAAKNPSGK